MRAARAQIAVYGLAAVFFAGCGSPTSASPPPSSAETTPSTIADAMALELDADRYEEALLHLLQSEHDATVRRARYLLARLYVESDREAEALEHFTRTADDSKLLAPWALLDHAMAAETVESFELGIKSLRRVIDEYGSSAATPEARIHLVRLLVANGTEPRASEEQVEKAFVALLAPRVDGQTEPLLVDLADSLDSLERHDLALRIRMHLLDTYPRGRYVERVFANVRTPPGNIASPFAKMSAKELDDLAEQLARYNRLDQALALLTLAEKKAPNAARRNGAVALRARILFRARQYSKVTSIQPSLTSKHYEEIQYLRALAYWRTDRNSQFLSTVDRLAKARPRSSKALDARVLVAKYHAVEDKDYAKAAVLMKAAVARGAIGGSGENLWLAAWYEVVAEKNGDALETLDDYLNRFPDADYTANALFWKGRLLDEKGDRTGRDSAFALLERVRPYDYFTWRARELGYLAADPPSAIESGLSFPEIRPIESFDDVRIRRALELESVGLIDRAVLEWRLAQADNSNDPSLSLGLADLYARAGQTSRSMSIVLGNFRDIVRHGAPDVPQRFWELLYPRTHWELITREAKRNGVDPWLVSAIIRQESAFEPTIVSSAGAVGLMQIMPKDASKIARSAGLGRNVRRADLFDVETSIRLGTHELANKRKKMDGNEILAIAAYNAGETAVSKWVAEMPIDDIDRFIESIPYPETRLYVKIVLKNRNEYRRVYGE